MGEHRAADGPHRRRAGDRARLARRRFPLVVAARRAGRRGVGGTGGGGSSGEPVLDPRRRPPAKEEPAGVGSIVQWASRPAQSRPEGTPLGGSSPEGGRRRSGRRRSGPGVVDEPRSSARARAPSRARAIAGSEPDTVPESSSDPRAQPAAVPASRSRSRSRLPAVRLLAVRLVGLPATVLGRRWGRWRLGRARVPLTGPRPASCPRGRTDLCPGRCRVDGALARRVGQT